MALDIRTYDEERDGADAARIWREVGWIEDSERHREGFAAAMADGSAEVGMLDGHAECLVHRTPGTITYDRTDLALCAITAVTTSLVGRKCGLATTLTARALRHGVDAGATVAALGMFEQGFYDRFGFATAGYDHRCSFDPHTLRVDHVPYRTPLRLDASNAAEMAAALQRRRRHHGAVVLDAERHVEAEFAWTTNPLALGYRNEAGELTHFLLGSLKDENGPLRITFLAARDLDQTMELLRLLHELGDQIRSVSMWEPAGVQLQALVDTPMRQRQRSLRTDFESGTQAVAWSQLRILDLDACVAARRWPGEPVRFVLDLTDPLDDLRAAAVTGRADDEGGASRLGLTGRHVVTVGVPSTVERVDPADPVDPELPVVSCDVGVFTRLWFGVAPASTLRATDRFSAPPALCERLDAALCLPGLVPGMQF